MFDKDFELLSIVSNFGSVRLIRVANMARAAIIQNRVSKSVSQNILNPVTAAFCIFV